MRKSRVKTTRRWSVVHINTHDVAGGAAKSAWRLAEIQRKMGHQAKMLVGFRKSLSSNSLSFPIEPDRTIQPLCQEAGQLFYEFQGSHKLMDHPLVCSADLLHFHNLHGWYFNPYSISALSHHKPVVWTLRDMQSITGHCAHAFTCEKWQTGCGQCPALDIEPGIPVDTSAQLHRDKKLIYEHSHLWIVTPSQWLKKKVEKSILKDHPVELIHNAVDTATFRPYDKPEVRNQLAIPKDRFVVGAVAHGGALRNPWKGGEYTLAALESLCSKFPEIIFVNGLLTLLTHITYPANYGASCIHRRQTHAHWWSLRRYHAVRQSSHSTQEACQSLFEIKWMDLLLDSEKSMRSFNR
jgi:glycosyltransferase involved in cell wall biosynthesis